MSDRDLEVLFGKQTLDRIHQRGYAVVPIEPTEAMQACASNGSTGTFSPWCLDALWLTLLWIADEHVRPHLPDADARRRNQEQALKRTKRELEEFAQRRVGKLG